MTAMSSNGFTPVISDRISAARSTEHERRPIFRRLQKAKKQAVRSRLIQIDTQLEERTMKTNLKKAVSFLLSLLLLVSALPTAAFASDEPETADDCSYLLGTAEDLLWFSEEVTGGND